MDGSSTSADRAGLNCVSGLHIAEKSQFTTLEYSFGVSSEKHSYSGKGPTIHFLSDPLERTLRYFWNKNGYLFASVSKWSKHKRSWLVFSTGFLFLSSLPKVILILTKESKSHLL